MLLNIFAEPVTKVLKQRTSKKLSTILKMNSQHLRPLPPAITFGSGDSIPDSVWDPELEGEPDYATGFDR